LVNSTYINQIKNNILLLFHCNILDSICYNNKQN